MYPVIATILTMLLIIFFFKIDKKFSSGVSNGVWVPFIWILISCSRTVSQWLNIRTSFPISEAYIEGNPLDRFISISLIIAGIYILKKRQINWSQFLIDNKGVWLFFIYGGLSLLWSDYPYVSFKRLIKGSGTVTMAMVILTEEKPILAVGTILKWISFILLPISLLLIRFFPELGRAYDAIGTPMYTGVGVQKNSLGAICLLTGLYFSWEIFLFNRESKFDLKSKGLIYLFILPLIAWLLHLANSATSLACLSLAVIFFFVSSRQYFFRKSRKILKFSFIVLLAFIILEMVFEIKYLLFSLLNRSADFTGRTKVWENYLSMVRNPIWGYGYEIFYTSVISKGLISEFRSTHSGYLEMYMNLGVIGVIFLTLWLIIGIKKIWIEIEHKYSEAVLYFSIIITVYIYNWTESSFSGDSTMWLLLFFSIIVTKKNDRPEDMK